MIAALRPPKLAWALLVATVGCGGLSRRVDRDYVRSLGVDGKLVLFDAENDLMIALDEREQVRRKIRDVKDDLADAAKQIEEAESDEERAQEKDDTGAAELASMAQDVFERKIEFLEGSLDLWRERLEAQDTLVLMAQAKYELAKAKLVLKNNIVSSDDLDIDDFTGQVDDMAGRAKDMQEELSETRQEVEALRQQWIEDCSQLQKASGGALGSPWLEDSIVWDNDLQQPEPDETAAKGKPAGGKAAKKRSGNSKRKAK